MKYSTVTLFFAIAAVSAVPHSTVTAAVEAPCSTDAIIEIVSEVESAEETLPSCEEETNVVEEEITAVDPEAEAEATGETDADDIPIDEDGFVTDNAIETADGDIPVDADGYSTEIAKDIPIDADGFSIDADVVTEEALLITGEAGAYSQAEFSQSSITSVSSAVSFGVSSLVAVAGIIVLI
jgi:hypothetical protein